MPAGADSKAWQSPDCSKYIWRRRKCHTFLFIRRLTRSRFIVACKCKPREHLVLDAHRRGVWPWETEIWGLKNHDTDYETKAEITVDLFCRKIILQWYNWMWAGQPKNHNHIFFIHVSAHLEQRPFKMNWSSRVNPSKISGNWIVFRYIYMYSKNCLLLIYCGVFYQCSTRKLSIFQSPHASSSSSATCTWKAHMMKFCQSTKCSSVWENCIHLLSFHLPQP